MEGKTDHPTTVDEYIAQYPEDVQQVLAKIRAVIKDAAPGAVEKVTYNMPGYELNGFLVSFAVWKNHIGVYPRTAPMQAIEGFSAYKGTKGSVHFPLNQPIPYDVIRKMVAVRIAENQASAG